MCTEMSMLARGAVSAISTPSKDKRPIATKEVIYEISFCIHLTKLHNIDLLGSEVADEPTGNIEINARFEFSGDNFRLEEIPINQVYAVRLTSEEAESLNRILVYGKQIGEVVLRLATNPGEPFRAVLCCPIIGNIFKKYYPLRVNLDAAIGVATFTARATHDILARRDNYVQKGLSITKKHGSEYIPGYDAFSSQEQLDDMNWFINIGGIWRPNDDTVKTKLIKIKYGGTGEGDYKIPIGKNYGSIHRIGYNGTQFSEREGNPKKEPIYFYDVWANLAFGYFLAKCGYNPDGAAKFARELGSFMGDDATDQQAVKLGATMNDFNEKTIIPAIFGKEIFFYEKYDKWTPLCVK